MIINIKDLTSYRAVIFEDLAKMMIRKINKNNFIFMTRRFDSINEISKKYRLDLNNISIDVLNILKTNFSSVDLIEFKLDNVNNRIVSDLIFYEVKTKSHKNSNLPDMCKKSYITYKFLLDNSCFVYTIFFVLFENWKSSFNIHKMNLNNFRVYSRYLKR